MNKLVNVYPSSPILSINPPIRTRLNKVNMSVENIRKCLISNAYIEEILNGNRIIQLNFENYDKDNDNKIETPKQTSETQLKPVEHKNVETTKPITGVKVAPIVEDKKKEFVSPAMEEKKIDQPINDEVKEDTIDSAEQESPQDDAPVEDNIQMEGTTPIENIVPEETTITPVSDITDEDKKIIEDSATTITNAETEDAAIEDSTVNNESVEGEVEDEDSTVDAESDNDTNEEVNDDNQNDTQQYYSKNNKKKYQNNKYKKVN